MICISDKYKGLSTLTGGFFYNLLLSTTFVWSAAGIYFTSYYRHKGFPHLTILPSYIVNPLIDVVTSMGLFFINHIKNLLSMRYCALLGGILISLTPIIASFSQNPYYFISIFVIGIGIGSAFIWILPIENIYEFYPNKKGLSSGITLSGVGIGSTVGNIILAAVINPEDVQPIEVNSTEKYFDRAVSEKFPFALQIIGMVYLAIALVGFFLTFKFERQNVLQTAGQIANQTGN